MLWHESACLMRHAVSLRVMLTPNCCACAVPGSWRLH